MSNIPVIPVGYRILVKQDVVEAKTESGIITMLQDTAEQHQAAHTRGTVVAVGPTAYSQGEDKFKTGPWCKVGDKIMFPSYAGKKFKQSDLSGVKEVDQEPHFHLMNDEDVLGVIVEESENGND